MNEDLFNPLLFLSNTTTPQEALESLIETSKTQEGRAKLASRNILPLLPRLCQNLAHTSSGNLLLLSLNLLKNLCERDILSIRRDFNIREGYEIISSIVDHLSSSGSVSGSDLCVIDMAFEILRHLSMEDYQYGIWHDSFPEKFMGIASVKSTEVCDVLCKFLHACCSIKSQLRELCGDEGLPILERIIVTASVSEDGAYTVEHGFLKLYSKTCIEEDYFPRIFSRLFNLNDVEYTEGLGFDSAYFNKEQAFLLRMLWKVFVQSQGVKEMSPYFASCNFEILKRSVKLVDGLPKAQSGLPTGSTNVDLLGYSLMILRHICDHNNKHFELFVDLLVSSGLIALLLSVLSDLGPPKKCEKCPYKGYRVDVIATIGNCLFQRKHVQDEIRERKGMILLLQQCNDDDNNEGLKTHGVQAVVNFMEGSRLNRKLVVELEGSADVSEISGLF